MRTIGYARVSTLDQDTGVQREAIMRRKVVGYNRFFNLWEVFDRDLMAVVGQYPTHKRAIEASKQLELFGRPE